MPSWKNNWQAALLAEWLVGWRIGSCHKGGDSKTLLFGVTGGIARRRGCFAFVAGSIRIQKEGWNKTGGHPATRERWTKKNSPLLKMGVQCNREAPPRLRTGYFKKGLAKWRKACFVNGGVARLGGPQSCVKTTTESLQRLALAFHTATIGFPLTRVLSGHNGHSSVESKW